MQKVRKPPYVVSLTSMHSVCETNYVRLSRLFPDYEKSNKKLNLKKYAINIKKFLKNNKSQIIFEPGRTIIANAGYLI